MSSRTATRSFLCVTLGTTVTGIPNIEREIAGSPVLFVQVLALFSTRDDDRQDPADWQVDDPERRAGDGTVPRIDCWKTSDVCRALTTRGGSTRTALSRWVGEARRLCGEHGRAGIGDNRIGQLLSRARCEENGAWPCRAVCEVLSTVAAQDITRGFELGVYNARGVVSRSMDEGGSQERKLSARYQAWAEHLVFDYPYVANILERIAKRYDREADWEDSDVLARKRLQH